MPHRLLRDTRIVTDEWRYLKGALATDPDDAVDLTGAGQAPLIVGFEQWQAERAALLARAAPLGVSLKPAQAVEGLAADLVLFALVAAEFPGPAEGRGYTQGRLLRERYEFSGELRAVGYVRRDQLFFLARCGFNAFALPETDLDEAVTAFATFTLAYQPTNDRGLAHKLERQ
jgi:uncharacterized protein (DUF934 family)